MTLVPLPQPLPPAPTRYSVQGTLALDTTPRVEPPAPRRPAVLADVVPLDERGRVEWWGRRYAQAAVEIVGGDRPASQLARYSRPLVHRDLLRRAEQVAEAGRHTPGTRRVQPVRPQVASVRASLVDDGVAEVTARVRYGRRSRALALRFEREPGDERWICCALEFV
jgi:hypothetical protein